MQNVTNLKFKDEDGSGNGTGVASVLIESVSNGYMVTWVYEDDSAVQEVFYLADAKELLKQLGSFLV